MSLAPRDEKIILLTHYEKGALYGTALHHNGLYAVCPNFKSKNYATVPCIIANASNAETAVKDIRTLFELSDKVPVFFQPLNLQAAIKFVQEWQTWGVILSAEHTQDAAKLFLPSARALNEKSKAVRFALASLLDQSIIAQSNKAQRLLREHCLVACQHPRDPHRTFTPSPLNNVFTNTGSLRC